MQEVLGAPSFKKSKTLMSEDFIFANEETENYEKHFDDVIEAFIKDIDHVRKVQVFLANVIQHSGRKLELSLDKIADILGSKLLVLKKQWIPPTSREPSVIWPPK